MDKIREKLESLMWGIVIAVAWAMWLWDTMTQYIISIV